MNSRFQFDPSLLHSVAGGRSIIDVPRLNLASLKEADAFLAGYGFSLDKPENLQKLWYYHRRALVLMTERLGISEDEIPERVRDAKQLEDLRLLLLWASSRDPREQELSRWSCAVLRVIHVFVHAENDLFSAFSEEIQKQILSPIQQSIYHEGTTGTTYLRRAQAGSDVDPIALVGFEVKPFKTSASTVVKLLAKPDALAMSVFDKLGVRFVASTMFDCFRVIRFLTEENLISVPHIMPDQSSNNLYPVELFLEVANSLARAERPLGDVDVQRVFAESLSSRADEFPVLRKENSFSGEAHRFIKFICRRLIRVTGPDGKSQIEFFYPFEVQIMDESSYRKIQSGPAEHQAYKERQREAAKLRILQSQGGVGEL